MSGAESQYHGEALRTLVPIVLGQTRETIEEKTGVSGNALKRAVRRLCVLSACWECTIESTWSANLLRGKAAIPASKVSCQSASCDR